MNIERHHLLLLIRIWVALLAIGSGLVFLGAHFMLWAVSGIGAVLIVFGGVAGVRVVL